MHRRANVQAFIYYYRSQRYRCLYLNVFRAVDCKLLINTLSSSGTLSMSMFGIFETAILLDFCTGARTLQTAQVASANTDMDI